MPDQKIATERIYAEDGDGVTRLVAAPGDPIPENPYAYGYYEVIDLEADTADARLAKGEKVPSLEERKEQAVKAAAERAAEKYAPPLPKPGEEIPADEGSKLDEPEYKAKKSAAVEDKAQKKS